MTYLLTSEMYIAGAYILKLKQKYPCNLLTFEMHL